MDLLSSIRKQGSRGGVDFKWDDVQTSAHRENYLGHSLMAPVGRWQKGKDLSWYAKADDADSGSNETAEERKVRERKEEIRKIKEAEEDALARALGLPVTPRNGGEGTGANDIDIGEMRRVIKETEDGDDEIDEVGRNAGFGDFVGKSGRKSNGGVDRDNGDVDTQQGGLLGKAGKKERHDRSRRKERGERRSRSRSRERRHRRHRQRSRSPEPHRSRDEEDSRRSKRHRSRSAERGQRHRSRSAEPHRSRRDERERRRSRSPNPRGRPRRWEQDEERERERERERRR